MTDEQFHPENSPSSIEQWIHHRLTACFNPQILKIDNQSSRHRHHPNAPNTHDSHFHVTLQAPCLKGLSRIEQQRCVYTALQEGFHQGLHALSLTIL